MILVGASAVGLTLNRWIDPGGGFWPVPRALLDHWAWRGPPSQVALACALGLVVAGLASPRGRRRRPARRPGFVASIMAVGVVPIGGVLAWTLTRWERHPPWTTVIYGPGWCWDSGVGLVPVAVGRAWIALGLVGRWRPEASWADRLGRALGLYWLAYWPVHLLQPLLKYAFPARF